MCRDFYTLSTTCSSQFLLGMFLMLYSKPLVLSSYKQFTQMDFQCLKRVILKIT